MRLIGSAPAMPVGTVSGQLEAHRKALITQDTGKLEEGDHHDPKKVPAFLNEWARKES